MYPIAVVKSMAWVNSLTGKRASVYGAVPWIAGPQPAEWTVQPQGYTLEMSNGTVGYGRPPLATKAEAEQVMVDWLKRIGRA